MRVSEKNKTFVQENGEYTIFDRIWLWIMKDFASRTSVRRLWFLQEIVTGIAYK